MTRVGKRRTDISDPPPLLSRPLVLLLLASFTSLASFYLLLSVVPLYAVAAGAGSVGAGLTTGAMLLATVLTEPAVPRLLARFGFRTAMAQGSVLLGIPVLVLIASPAMPLLIAVSLVRGVGLAILVVTGTALVAELVPAQRRGEGLGLYGVAVGIPAILGLPLGVWLSDLVGFPTVFGAGAAICLLALAAVPGLPADRAKAANSGGTLPTIRRGELVRPTLVFAAITLAAGVVVTFLPLAGSTDAHERVAVALLVFSVLTPIARWGAGKFGDRYGSSALLVPAVLASAMGMAGLLWVSSPVGMIVSMALFGLGFGSAQNLTLALMFERVSKSEFGRVSALWNLAYDAGMGIGAVGFGVMVGITGFPLGFAVTAAVVLVAVAPAIRDTKMERAPASLRR